MEWSELTTLSGKNASLECVSSRVYEAIFLSEIEETFPVAEQAILHILPYVLMICSILIGFLGHTLLRPSFVFICFCIGTAAGLYIYYEYAAWLHNWSCEAILIASVCTGCIFGLMGGVFVQAISFCMGAMTGAALTVLFFDLVCESCNDELWPNAPMFLGRHIVPFWITFVATGLIGGYLCKRQHETTTSILTSLVGGWGTMASLNIILNTANAPIAGWVYLLINLAVSACGFLVQQKLLKRNRQKTQTKQKPKEDAETA